MNEAANELSLIRKYLLGGLKGEEREQLEERVLLDPEFKDRVLIVEENLIEEYAEGALEDEERQRFQMMFNSNPQRRLEVQVVDGLQQHADAKWWTKLLQAAPDRFLKSRGTTRASAPASTKVAALNWLPAFGKVAIAFALVVTVMFAFLIVQRFLPADPTSVTQDQSRRDLIERELARLNSRESQSLPAARATTLSPGLSRGDETQRSVEFPTVTLPRGTESVQLRLLLRPSAHEYGNFQAVLSPVDGRESYKVDLEGRVDSADAPALVLTVPAHALDDGDYRVQLIGDTAGGKTEALPDHYYYFRLVRQ